MTGCVRRAAARAIAIGCWLVAGLTALTAVLRLAHLDNWPVVVALIAVSPWLYALTVIVVVAALVGRRWRLVAVAGILTVLGLVTVLPSFLPLSRAAKAPAGSVTLRLFDANVRYNNPSLAGIAAEITADHPDVVTLEELTPTGLATLTASGALSRFRWHLAVPATGGANGLGIWSDHPLRDAVVWHAGSHPEISSQVEVTAQRSITVDVIHTNAPVSGWVHGWRDQLADIAAKAKTQPRPLVLAGDFNATAQMYELSGITAVGLKDAAVEAGEGWRTTWSRLLPVIPPLVRIDHVLYSPGLTVTSYRLGHGEGSDHRPLLVSIAVLPTTASR